MKILRELVLVVWVLVAAIGLFCGGNASADTLVVSGVGGVSVSDAGWG
ncbi:hypothetical protein [Streptomyces sp. NPDC052042]